MPSARTFSRRIQVKAYSDQPEPRSIILPSLWFADKEGQEISAVTNVRALLKKLTDHQISLDSVTWRELEEIVAELLKSQGLQVHVTPRSHDGGRDIVARGELLPGEPATIAVEVKHKRVVGISDFERALYANRNFPALLFATSRRFSAGVISEKRQECARLRVILKDGVALGQWLSDYAFQTGLKK